MEYVPGGDLLKTVQQCMAAKVCRRMLPFFSFHRFHPMGTKPPTNTQPIHQTKYTDPARRADAVAVPLRAGAGRGLPPRARDRAPGHQVPEHHALLQRTHQTHRPGACSMQFFGVVDPHRRLSLQHAWATAAAAAFGSLFSGVSHIGSTNPIHPQTPT